MNKREKTKFVRDLMGSIQKTIIKNIDRMPDEWDGSELRQYIADKTADLAGSLLMRQKGSAFKDYKNEVITRNL